MLRTQRDLGPMRRGKGVDLTNGLANGASGDGDAGKITIVGGVNNATGVDGQCAAHRIGGELTTGGRLERRYVGASRDMGMNSTAAELLAEIERSGSGSRAFWVKFWQAVGSLSDAELRRVLVATGRRAAPERGHLASRYPLGRGEAGER